MKRGELGLTLGDVAERLGCSVSYVSDVERQRRAPFDDDRLADLADLFEIPADEVLAAARLTRGITLETTGTTESHREAALALARSWKKLSAEQLSKIIEATRAKEE
jgi:transcriptional regulator with XRE-family HTH domain